MDESWLTSLALRENLQKPSYKKTNRNNMFSIITSAASSYPPQCTVLEKAATPLYPPPHTHTQRLYIKDGGSHHAVNNWFVKSCYEQYCWVFTRQYKGTAVVICRYINKPKLKPRAECFHHYVFKADTTNRVQICLPNHTPLSTPGFNYPNLQNELHVHNAGLKARPCHWFTGQTSNFNTIDIISFVNVLWWLLWYIKTKTRCEN